MSIRVRFAPSPTGNVHIGNIRTAIFNWLLARHEGGEFLLRVEDTDRERSTQEAIDALLDVMAWIGLSYDGEPVYQSGLREAHLTAEQKLLASGDAYRHSKGDGGEATLFRIPLDLASVPFAQPGEMVELALSPADPVVVDGSGISYSLITKKGKAHPQACCLAGMQELAITDKAGAVTLLADHLEQVLKGGALEVSEPVSLQFRRWSVSYDDQIKGTLSKPIDSLKDFVIVRSDGNPVFHLANVCDDISQGVTHIIRGDDHVENTYRHLFLFHALGAELPAYGHLPMITNAQGKPYSKRDGDAFVGDFRAKGFLPHALFNYLTLLGWAPGDDREKMTVDELVEAFTLDRVGSAPAIMDVNKLENLNGKYLADKPACEFIDLARTYAADCPWFAAADPAYFDQVAALMQSRTKLMTGVGEWYYFFSDDLTFDEKATRKNLAKPGIGEALLAVRDGLATDDFDEETVEAAIHAVTEAREIKQGKLNLPLRVALTGTPTGAGLYEIIVLLGRETSLKRLEWAAENLCTTD